MAVGRIDGYQPRYYPLQSREQVVSRGDDAAEKMPDRDTLEISAEGMEKSRESFDETEEETIEEEENSDNSEENEAEKTGGCVGINSGKLARMLAAAKTRSQVQAVMEMIMSDLRECDAGKEQGLDVDEASVKAAESLLEEAKSRMSSAEDREPTPQEEMESALASLM